MTDPSVTNFIQSKTDKVQGWHAFSQAVATQVKSQEGIELKVEKELNISEDAVFVNGGTCAAMRSIGMMHIFGFRNFHLFGFDCSIDKEPSEEDLKKKIRNETPKFMKVETNGKEFWTTGELLAMAQDCEKLFDNSDIEMDVKLYGEDTLVKEIYDVSAQGKKTHYSDLISTTKEAA
tara:strand:- start:470 stop:1000 length:531 start_codon:yes stop_codon:yes gene_type:complete